MGKYIIINKIFKLTNYIIRFLYFFINKKKPFFKVLIKTTFEKIKFYCPIKNEFKYKYPTNLQRVFGLYEPLTSLFIKRHIKKNFVVVEIGAAYGYFTIQMSKKAKIVHSIEPSKKMLKNLEYNLNLNNIKNCKIYEMGITTKKLTVDNCLIKNKSNLKDFLKDRKIFPDFIFVDADAFLVNGMPYNVGEDIILEIIKMKFKKKISIFFESKNYKFYLERILENKKLKNKRMISHQHFYFEK